MKLTRYLAALLAGILAGCLLTGCTTTTITAPDGTVTTIKSADQAAYTLAGAIVTAYAPPRARRIREEKSGPITAEEIKARFKAAR